MSAARREDALQRLLDRAEIEEIILRYARGVDRGDWDLIRTLYHPGAFHDYIEYRGDVGGFIEYAKGRLASARNGMHFLGNRLIEFVDEHVALAETYYLAQRHVPPAENESTLVGSRDAIVWFSWGRYLDRFERRDGEWRIAHREIALDTRYSVAALNVAQRGPSNWGSRDLSDPLYTLRERVRSLKGTPT